MKGLFPSEQDTVSFETFMSYALHDPKHGYYARSISTVGRGGDFTTTAEISPALAKAIAAWLQDQLRATKCVHVIELGPGSGALAAAVCAQLPWHVRWRTQWHLVETSTSLRKLQQQRPELGRAQWHDSVETALSASGGAACLYSNEFFDAFPVRLFQYSGDEWLEIYVRQSHYGLVECLVACDQLPNTSLWQRSWHQSQRVEVHQTVQKWLQALARHWQRGAMLTIDYGATADLLYTRQPMGSLRSYRAQQRMTGPDLYKNVGHQDITADVNFTDLMDWSHSFAAAQSLQTQAEFLAPFVDSKHLGDIYASDPWGAGGAFQVWHCTAGK
jgi:SAM-dependent MidA family methyltransferase